MERNVGTQRASQGRETTHQQERKKHLIVLCNGLWGQSKHWKSVRQALEEKFESRCEYQVHVSTANQLFTTYAGIDVCGSALAGEVESVIDEGFGKISFIGHSMGGLIARNAVKKMYEKETRTILGLQPCHFVTLATPHVGFVPHHDHEDVPLAQWVKGFMPFGSRKILDVCVPFLTSYFLGEAGKQFFYRDQQGRNPILYDMSQDHWLEPLQSFQTRTCYANMSGDHLVGWGNSSIRTQEDLARVQVDTTGRKRLGVVREDPIEYAWLQCSNVPSHNPSKHTASNSPRYFQQKAMIKLQSLGWRRIDVCFRDSPLWYLSHQHIMVQRPSINGIGMATAKHLAEQLYIMESLES